MYVADPPRFEGKNNLTDKENTDINHDTLVAKCSNHRENAKNDRNQLRCEVLSLGQDEQ